MSISHTLTQPPRSCMVFTDVTNPIQPHTSRFCVSTRVTGPIHSQEWTLLHISKRYEIFEHQTGTSSVSGGHWTAPPSFNKILLQSLAVIQIASATRTSQITSQKARRLRKLGSQHSERPVDSEQNSHIQSSQAFKIGLQSHFYKHYRKWFQIMSSYWSPPPPPNSRYIPSVRPFQCVCVCVCDRQTDRQTETERDWLIDWLIDWLVD